MRSVFPYLALAGLLGAIGWAVSFGTLPPADFSFCNESEIKTIDPAIVTGQPEGRVIRGLFEGLVNWHPEDLHPIPGVADRWTISDDRLTYRFHIRPDAQWSDGSPVTSEDFVYSFRRFLHPATGAEYAYQLHYVRGARDFNHARVKVGESVEIELYKRPENALPDAPGVIVRGRLVDVEPPLPDNNDEPADDHAVEESESEADDIKRTYTVEIDGRMRRFRQREDERAEPSPDGGENYRWLLPDFEEVAIRAPDPATLIIELENPTPYFLTLTGFYPLFPVNRECVETHPFPSWTKPENLVCNGPYILESRRIRDRVRLRKNPYYWDRDNIHFETVDALAIESLTTALNMYLTGQLDYIPQVPATVVPTLLEQDRVDFNPTPYLGTYYYRINTTRPPLDNPLVRRALSRAIDREEIVTRVTRAGQLPGHSFVPPGLAGYEQALCEGYDPEEAKRLLAEAGYPGGRGFPANLEIMYNTHEMHKSIAELIQSQWKRVLGIDVKLQNQEWAAYLSHQRQLQYSVCRAAWIGDYPDPNTFLDMFVSDGANNQTGWGNAEYDRLIEAAAREAEPEARMALLHDAEEILMDELPIIPVYYYVSTFMVKPYVEGFYPNIQDVHPLQGMRIDTDKKRLAIESLR